MAGNLLYLLAVVLAFVAAAVLPVIGVLDDSAASVGERDWAAIYLIGIARRLAPTLPVLVALCLFHSLLMSHRVAGPVYRFMQVLRGIGRGNLDQRVILRRNDFLKDEADQVNLTITSLSLKIEKVRDAAREASATLPPLAARLRGIEDDETRVLLGKLATHLDELSHRVSAFDLPGAGAQKERESAASQNRCSSSGPEPKRSESGAGTGYSSA